METRDGVPAVLRKEAHLVHEHSSGPFPEDWKHPLCVWYVCVGYQNTVPTRLYRNDARVVHGHSATAVRVVPDPASEWHGGGRRRLPPDVADGRRRGRNEFCGVSATRSLCNTFDSQTHEERVLGMSGAIL